MKVLINTFGTEGDVRPFVALARKLVAAGHQAAICTPAGFARIVHGHGVEHLPMTDAALDLVQAQMKSANGPADTLRVVPKLTAAMRQMMLDEWSAAAAWRPEAVVYHPKCLGALHIAERLDLPAYLSLPLPFFTPTTAFPVPFVARDSLPGWLNRGSYAFNHVTMLAYGSMINTFRTDVLGLRRRPPTDSLQRRDDGTPIPTLYVCSPHLVPRPADYPDHASITGAWNIPPEVNWQPPEDLREFLEAGKPAVYVGFGSMGFGREANRRTQRIVQALLDQQQRVVLATGWGGLTAVAKTPDVHSLDNVTHDGLLPRTAAVIHHGGSGTTHTGLRAGKPTLIIPFLGDQPFWGHRVHANGAGPAPIPARRITERRSSDRWLESVIDQLVHDEAIVSTAHQLGQKLSAEQGTAAAVKIITGSSALHPD